MTIVVLGRDGQVGFELRRSLAPLGPVVAFGRRDCDLADAAALRRTIAAARPTVIVNAAAYTQVDRAESEPDLAFAVNAAAPAALASVAAECGALLVHYSTDYVFDGAKTAPYLEDDATNPVNAYGASKLAGERAVTESGAAHLIFRTSWVYGAVGANFAKTMLRLAAERDALSIVADQTGAPTSAALIADVTAQVLGRRRLGHACPSGVYHLAAGGETTWFDYARTVIAAAERAGRPLRCRAEAVRPIATADYPTPAKRPANSRLSTAKLADTFGLMLPDWRDGLDHILPLIL